MAHNDNTMRCVFLRGEVYALMSENDAHGYKINIVRLNYSNNTLEEELLHSISALDSDIYNSYINPVRNTLVFSFVGEKDCETFEFDGTDLTTVDIVSYRTLDLSRPWFIEAAENIRDNITYKVESNLNTSDFMVTAINLDTYEKSEHIVTNPHKLNIITINFCKDGDMLFIVSGLSHAKGAEIMLGIDKNYNVVKLSEADRGRYGIGMIPLN